MEQWYVVLKAIIVYIYFLKLGDYTRKYQRKMVELRPKDSTHLQARTRSRAGDLGSSRARKSER